MGMKVLGGWGGGKSRGDWRWKSELQGELGNKVNLGFSMRYLTSGVGGVNLADYLLRVGPRRDFFLGGGGGEEGGGGDGFTSLYYSRILDDIMFYPSLNPHKMPPNADTPMPCPALLEGITRKVTP